MNTSTPRLAIALAAITLWSLPASSQPTQNLVKCPPRWGKAGQPLVSRSDTAKAIFSAVEKDFFPQADRTRFPDVEANDDGKWWSVFRWRKAEVQRNGDAIVTRGGGQLSMRIDKCTATISHVFLSR